MDTLTICSNDDLSILGDLAKERFPDQMITMKDTGVLHVNKRYIDEFCSIFSKWYHKNNSKSEIKTLLAESFVLSPEEEHEVLLIIPEYVRQYENELCMLIQKKAKIMLKEFQFLMTSGFSIFCLREYREKLEEIIEASLEQYLSERDYHEFLNLLRYYAEVEESHFGSMIVVADKNGNYHYYDETYHNITNQCVEQFYHEFDEEVPTADDCLITVLILMLPEKITLYGAENISNEKFKNTLKNIFQSRLELCFGTELS